MFIFFFFNDTATTEIYTLSLHDALPISMAGRVLSGIRWNYIHICEISLRLTRDRKSTRLNSSHSQISYAVFCLKKKKQHRLAVGLRDFVDKALPSVARQRRSSTRECAYA